MTMPFAEALALYKDAVEQDKRTFLYITPCAGELHLNIALLKIDKACEIYTRCDNFEVGDFIRLGSAVLIRNK